MCAPDRVASVKLLKAGYIMGYRLTFDKVSKKDGSRKCDAELTWQIIPGIQYQFFLNEGARLD
jgi:hypothetical protein